MTISLRSLTTLSIAAAFVAALAQPFNSELAAFVRGATKMN